MPSKVIMPQGGQDLESGKVVRWLVTEGTPVKRGDVICEVETEKAVFEVNAPAEGILRQILVKEGEEAKVFATIGLITAPGEALPGASGERPAATAAAPAPGPTPVSSPTVESASPPGQKIRISPKAKRMARTLGIEYSGLKGTGPLGRIVAADILAAQAAAAAQPAAPAIPTAEPVRAAPASPPAPERVNAPAPVMSPSWEVTTVGAPGKVVPLTKIRKVIAQRMQASKQFIPHFYVTVAVDMTEALRFRARLNKRPGLLKEDQLSVNDLIVRACVLALKEFPELNSSVLDDDHLMLWDDLHLGIAVALDEGLVVPVLEHADWLNLVQLPRQTRRIIQLAKEGKQASLSQPRFTISNLGMYNIEIFTAIINPPEAAILAVASVEKRVMPPAGDQLGLRLRDMLNLTLSVDHRIGDGVLAARFLNRVRALLEEPDCLT